ncbi:GNAT family N-acetyltransferase [Haloplanus halophilus]|uniref:GNAT family N-acetyltransferase n=1 Tax=Haloplanus halophilus TaxID=2949993 RepID=UPI00203F5DE4|nr:N-acetyltransferase [Haloplanus sp. GDY1]
MIRAARPDDAAALARLQSHLREPSPGLLDGALADGELSPATALVATAEGSDDPVGYLLAVPGDGTTYVAELVVDPDHRREGRATALLSACATDAERVTVTVAPDNEAARSLYRRRGFEEVRRLPEFFEDGAAILYRR